MHNPIEDDYAESGYALPWMLYQALQTFGVAGKFQPTPKQAYELYTNNELRPFIEELQRHDSIVKYQGYKVMYKDEEEALQFADYNAQQLHDVFRIAKQRVDTVRTLAHDHCNTDVLQAQ